MQVDPSISTNWWPWSLMAILIKLIESEMRSEPIPRRSDTFMLNNSLSFIKHFPRRILLSTDRQTATDIIRARKHVFVIIFLSNVVKIKGPPSRAATESLFFHGNWDMGKRHTSEQLDTTFKYRSIVFLRSLYLHWFDTRHRDVCLFSSSGSTHTLFMNGESTILPLLPSPVICLSLRNRERIIFNWWVGSCLVLYKRPI